MKTLKNSTTLMICTLAIMAWTMIPVSAYTQEHQDEHGDHRNEAGHESDAGIPEHAGDIAAEILTRDLLIRDLIAEGRLLKIHVPAFEAKDLSDALVEKAGGLNEKDKKTLAAAVKRIGASAKLLDKYGDGEDADKTKSAYTTFGKAIQDIKNLFPNVTPSHYWTCSMHPEIWEASAGTCSKCSMKLVEKGESGHGDHDEDEDEEHHDDDEDEHGDEH